jgi:hypothetical protein
MTGSITNVQRLSMKRAEEGVKFLRAEVAALDALGNEVPNLSGDRTRHETFRAAVAARAKSLHEAEGNIFEMVDWKGASGQREKLKHAISRVEHCRTAVIYSERKKIIESALAEAKDLIEQCIVFLESEAHRFPEIATGPQQPNVPATKIEPSDAKRRIKLQEVITIKLPFGFGTVDPIKLAQWIRERLR